MDVAVEIEKNENCAVDMSIVVPGAELESRKDSILTSIRDRVEVQGFRKGHVPKSILEKRFGPQATAEGLQDLLKDAVQAAFEKQDLIPLDTPKVSDIQMDNGKIRFKVSVDVQPRLKLTDDQILRLPIPKPAGLAVTDEDVAAAVENERKTTATFQPVLEIRPAQPGDFAVIDFEGFLKDKDAPIEGGKAEGTMMEIGGGRYIPGFDDQIAGMKPGEKKRIDVAFPADFYDEELQGKSAYFHVTLHAIKKRQMPDMTDEWAKEHGFENLADMRSKIRAEMERGAQEMSQDDVRRALFNILDERISLEMPPSIVARQAADLMQGIERQYKGGRKELLDKISRDGKTEADLEAEVRDRARRQLKNSLILDTVARTKNIRVTEEEIEKRIDQIAAQRQTTHEAVHGELEKSGRMDELQYAVLHEKVVQFLLDNADIR